MTELPNFEATEIVNSIPIEGTYKVVFVKVILRFTYRYLLIVSEYLVI